MREAAKLTKMPPKAAPAEDDAEPIEAPAWLHDGEAELFRELVKDARAANGNVLKVDAFVFANIAKLQFAMMAEPDANKAARFMRTLLPWATAAGLTAVGRARLHVAPKEKPKVSVTAQLLAMTKRQ